MLALCLVLALSSAVAAQVQGGPMLTGPIRITAQHRETMTVCTPRAMYFVVDADAPEEALLWCAVTGDTLLPAVQPVRHEPSRTASRPDIVVQYGTPMPSGAPSSAPATQSLWWSLGWWGGSLAVLWFLRGALAYIAGVLCGVSQRLWYWHGPRRHLHEEEGGHMPTTPPMTWPQILALSEEELNLAIDQQIDQRIWRVVPMPDGLSVHTYSTPLHPETTASWERTMALANRMQIERCVADGWHYWVAEEEGAHFVRVPLDADAHAHRVAICRLVLWRAGQGQE